MNFAHVLCAVLHKRAHTHTHAATNRILYIKKKEKKRFTFAWCTNKMFYKLSCLLFVYSTKQYKKKWIESILVSMCSILIAFKFALFRIWFDKYYESNLIFPVLSENIPFYIDLNDLLICNFFKYFLSFSLFSCKNKIAIFLRVGWWKYNKEKTLMMCE